MKPGFSVEARPNGKSPDLPSVVTASRECHAFDRIA
jgi:hypothetical protein